MQVEAIYENGKLKFKQPLHLKNKKFTVMVTLPDDAIEEKTPYNLPPEEIERARALLQRMEAIKNAPLLLIVA
ncbi:hypothetical protein D5125_17345 [Magnetovirga frankeli]|uniref:antitoxin AF2212-like protein n=1 Tax=Magnetovirga frankeli TaxID=947516 RepID=UPI001293855B|nr:hypothetical protein D5125_17345 [gamma proteobacterium SS-5]